MLDKALRGPIRLEPKKFDESDPYAYKLFELEKHFAGACVYHTVSKASLMLLAEDAAFYYNLDPPTIHIVNRPAVKQYGWVENGDIYLNRAIWGANTTTLMHEIAHIVVQSHLPPDVEDHGPEFLGVYMHLLDKYRILPQEAFRLLARKWGLKIHRRYKPEALCCKRS